MTNKTTVRPVNMGGQHAGMDAQIISVYNEEHDILIEMQAGKSQHKTHALIMSLMELAIGMKMKEVEVEFDHDRSRRLWIDEQCATGYGQFKFNAEQKTGPYRIMVSVYSERRDILIRMQKVETSVKTRDIIMYLMEQAIAGIDK